MKDKDYGAGIVPAVTLLLFLIFLIYRIALIFYPVQDAGGVEGNIIYFIQRLLDGHALYTDPEQPPYAIAQYAPGYYLIVTGVAKLLGAGPDDLMQLFAINRTVGLLFNLGFAVTVYRIAAAIFQTGSRLALIAATSSFVFLEISSYARPDSLHHFLFLLSVYFLLSGIRRSQEKRMPARYLVLSAGIAACALFAKQTSVVIPLVAGGWMLLHKRTKDFLRFAFTYAIFTLVFLVIIYFTGDLHLFYKNVVLGINNGINRGWYMHVILQPFYFRAGFIMLLLFLWVVYQLRKHQEPVVSFSLFALVLFFLLLNLVMLKNGSNAGYMTEWWTLLVILSAYCVKNFPLKKITKAGLALACCSILGWKLWVSHKMMLNTVSPSMKIAARAHYESQRRLAGKLLDTIAGKEGYTVFLNVYTPDNYLANLLHRHAVLPQMDIVVLSSYPDAKYDYKEFERSLSDGRIRWMIMNETGPQKRFFQLSLDKFEFFFNEAAFNIYQYKP